MLVGEAAQVMAALSQSGWSFTHRIDWTTVRRMIAAALAGTQYPNAPVSDLYAFGRRQDLAFQRARFTLAQRNHMRLWLAPYTVEGRSVWIGQVSRDIGIKLTRKSPTFTTHVIDPLVDETRQYLLESLLQRHLVAEFGFVRAFDAADLGQPRRNLTDDPYISDGMRLIVVLATQPTRIEDVRNLGWRQTTLGPIERGQSPDRGSPRPPLPAGGPRDNAAGN
ncbi:MAG: LssY C-terminal domain-containing protein [Comamonadaceae bacterium]|nr:LssY C-terminal domain-containing protein [Comamonadaceae bacterium]